MSVENNQIIGVVRNALGWIDARLMNHGERVAYIIHEMLAEDELFDEFDWDTLLILALFHDVGAYKTEEIDRMVEFETNDIWSHAIFGYLFLENIAVVEEYAEAVLFHHASYRSLLESGSAYREYAALICLADRVDILITLQGKDVDLSRLAHDPNGFFSPRFMDLFLRANEQRGIVAHVAEGDAADVIDAAFETLDISTVRAFDYLRMVVNAIDFRSPFTVTHTITTETVARELAALAGMDDVQIERIGEAALLHDIGKIAIPLEILENPGKLTDAEMEVMRTHVTIGECIVDGLVPDPVRDIAMRHHEKLNGTGYPRGLVAEQLSVEQRMLAVADVVSALVGRRSYKEPFSKDKTLGIIDNMSERGELCPEICRLLRENYEQVLGAVDARLKPTVMLYAQMRGEYERMKELTEMLGDAAVPLLIESHRQESSHLSPSAGFDQAS